MLSTPGGLGADFRIDDLPPADGLAGSEGLDVNYASRIRIHYLLGQNHAMVTQMQFADAKAAALMTLMGLVALRGPVDIAEIGPGDPLGMATLVLNACCLAACIWAIIPRYPGAGLRQWLSHRDRFSWPALTSPDYGALDYAEFMRTSDISQLVMSVAQSNSAMAGILLKKFLTLRVAFFLAIANVTVMALRVTIV